MLLGGFPHDRVLGALEMGDPKGVRVLASDRDTIALASQDLLGQTVSDLVLARLAGALDDADVVASVEGGGIKLEMHRGGVRAVRWIGLDYAGRLKVELVRLDIPLAQQAQGLASRSVARTVQQASILGVQYADATAVRSAREGGYYSLARLGFDAVLPRDWLEVYRDDLKRLGYPRLPRRLSALMATPEGRQFWLVNGRTIEVTMDLRPGSVDMFRLAQYIQQRRAEGRPMAESKTPEGPRPPYVCRQTGLVLTEEDEKILDRIWEMYPITEEEERRKEEFFASIRPGTRRRWTQEDQARLEARAAELRRQREQQEAQQQSNQ